MRVTNGMMTNNSLINMNKNKEKYNYYLQQYSTQLKIQKPSDDPTVAVRSLKYRTRMVEITQYLDKNIKDANNWMDATESAMKQVNTILTNMSELCTQGANGTLTAEERTNISATLKQYKEYIYEQQGNADYAGRYLFTGYRTDVSYVFGTESKNLTYNINEDADSSKMKTFSYAYGGSEYSATGTAASYAADAPEYLTTHVMQLSYNDCDNSAVTISYTDSAGDPQIITPIIKSTADDTEYNEHYNVGENEVYYIPETGELVFGDKVYEEMTNSTEISVNYSKTNFTGSDVRPEHYFDCTSTNAVTGEVKNYTEPEGQQIQYEINFSQKLTVNTLGKNAFDLSTGRAVDRVVELISNMDLAQGDLADIEKRIKETSETDTDTLTALNELKEQTENKISMIDKSLQDSFSNMITTCQSSQGTLNVAVADHGARQKRLSMTESKLKDQKVDFEEALSDNEDVDIGEAYINYNEADLLYQACLTATSKVLGNTLLDFI